MLRILSHASAVIAEGEVEQLTAQRRIETGEDQYLDDRRAPRPRPCSQPPAASSPVVAEASEDAELALESYGRNLGIAFQLTDDIIDYASDSATMGKGVGDDFRDGKMTLPGHSRLCARERGRPRVLARGDRRRAHFGR